VISKPEAEKLKSASSGRRAGLNGGLKHAGWEKFAHPAFFCLFLYLFAK